MDCGLTKVPQGDSNFVGRKNQFLSRFCFFPLPWSVICVNDSLSWESNTGFYVLQYFFKGSQEEIDFGSLVLMSFSLGNPFTGLLSVCVD